MDVLLDILNEMVKAHPASDFVNSLHQQYCNRGGLSKKQLEGLHSKASRPPIFLRADLQRWKPSSKKTQPGNGLQQQSPHPSCKDESVGK
ncbi:MAG: hypothetical protein IPI88_14395 [Chitinophagaceae bacterium]|nr:hypothetical protein [Chitinophagaceae bacterium]